MIRGRSVIALIPARGGSKSIPWKNITPLAGKPLLAWSIDVARRVPEIDGIFVSTDSPKIARVAEKYGARVIRRPAALSRDESPTVDAVRHALATLKKSGMDVVHCVLLEPTCPLRTPADIRRCLRLLSDEGYDSVATFKEASLNPWRAWTLEGGRPKSLAPRSRFWLPRQKLKKTYQLNGAVYAFKTSSLHSKSRHLLNGNCGAVLMDAAQTVDVDDVRDLEFAEFLMKRRGRR